MNISKACLDIVKEFEGLFLKAYLCPAGVPTIGYGHTSAAGAPLVREGMVITEAEADLILENDLKFFVRSVQKTVKVPLAQHELDALVSFCFNVGPGAFERSSLVKVLNAGKRDQVPAQLMRWTKADGKELRGLVRRRRAEAALWRGDTDRTPALAGRRVITKMDPPAVTKPMVKSREGWAGIVGAASAAVLTVKEAANGVGQAVDAAQSASGSISTVLASIAANPWVALGAAGMVAGAAVWFLRRQRLNETGL